MLGIVFEGGASRTVFSCGVMDCLLKMNVQADYVVGTSAGAAFGISYVSRQFGRNRELVKKYMCQKKYMGFRHFINPKNKAYYNLDYVFDEIPNEILPLDFETFDSFGGKFEAAVTNIETGEAEYFEVTSKDKSFTSLRASCALPLLFPPIEINNAYYMDGGFSDSIPIDRSLEMGCNKNIVVLTRPMDYVKQDEKMQKLVDRIYKNYPNFLKAAHQRTEKYNNQTDRLKQMARNGEIILIVPKTTFNISRTENNPKKLDELYKLGYVQTKKMQQQIQEYLEK